ncbi:acyltransferase ChoActase/COT/CPT [Collybia nuda]|uniref:Carnitine O-acetyltransferase, mitochondrial n=1 Tax=Collybia nuda TaxID=64659 RepID=A0A9P5XXL3_9AGAR|nr:acyltransferase ChoActase/COT/CPT [Collybia nuda]
MPARRTHTYSEDPSAPPMLRYQASLPPLPVPSLSSTLAKYIETVEPLLTPAQLAHTKKSADEFLASPIAATLQARLLERAAAEGDNWLSKWWNEVAYMGYRDPVVVFVSYFFVHVQDRRRTNGPQAAAALIKAMLPFREMVVSGKLEPEKIRGAPLCMDSYKWLYPTIPSDTARAFPASENNHIIVLRKNRFFVVPLAVAGREISAPELEAQFKQIIAAAGPTPASTPLGALTSDNRDNWTHAREALVKNPANAALLQKIESAMIVVCLDDTAPVTRDDVSWETWVGNGRNRWYDKHQLIVYENGRSGFLGEHSCMDGTPTLRMNEFVLATLGAGKVDLGPVENGNRQAPKAEELVFAVDDTVKGLVRDAESRFDTLVGAHDLHVLHYEAYGKSLMKKHKLSPDAWAQLVKQLAFDKMYGRPAVTYESAQTRKFKLGRTEVIRSVSNEGKAWVEAMRAGRQDPIHLRTLFQRAVSRHMQYSAWAADGQGVDRHLFGLKKSLQPGEEVPALYKDETFTKSSHWELSTSQLSSQWFDGWGYGEVVPDGYGLSYAIGDNYIRWTVTSLKKGSKELAHYLAEAATEVRDMMEAARKMDEKKETGEGAGRAKL